MATTYTPNLRLQKPAFGDTSWDGPLLANINRLDGLAPVANLAVSTTETPSASLNVRVSGGSFRPLNGIVATYAGVDPYAIAVSSTLNLWLTDAGVLASGASWPTTPHVPLATVTGGTTTITGIVDARVAAMSIGGNPVRLLTASSTVTTADNYLRCNATSGSIVLTLPDATTCTGQIFRLFKSDAGGNSVSFAAVLSQTISGTASTTTPNTSRMIISNGTGWDVF